MEVIKIGEKFICPCGEEEEAEPWRLNDGPCRDGEFYCIDCLLYSVGCGCTPHVITWKESTNDIT